MFTIKTNGTQGDLPSLLSDIFDDRYQRTVLTGKASEWARVPPGVPQGSVLGPLMFLLYINDITVDIKYNMRIFAGDVAPFHIVEDPFTCFDDVQHDLNKISVWATQWCLHFKLDITKQTVEVIFSNKTNHHHTPFIVQ